MLILCHLLFDEYPLFSIFKTPFSPFECIHQASWTNQRSFLSSFFFHLNMHCSFFRIFYTRVRFLHVYCHGVKIQHENKFDVGLFWVSQQRRCNILIFSASSESVWLVGTKYFLLTQFQQIKICICRQLVFCIEICVCLGVENEKNAHSKLLFPFLHKKWMSLYSRQKYHTSFFCFALLLIAMKFNKSIFTDSSQILTSSVRMHVWNFCWNYSLYFRLNGKQTAWNSQNSLKKSSENKLIFSMRISHKRSICSENLFYNWSEMFISVILMMKLEWRLQGLDKLWLPTCTGRLLCSICGCTVHRHHLCECALCIVHCALSQQITKLMSIFQQKSTMFALNKPENSFGQSKMYDYCIFKFSMSDLLMRKYEIIIRSM